MKLLLIIIPVLLISTLFILYYLGIIITPGQIKKSNEQVLNLASNYNDKININLIHRSHVKNNCRCLGNLSVDNACLIEICDIVWGKYVQEYEACANNNSSLCVLTEYHDDDGNWFFPGGYDSLDKVLFMSQTLRQLDKYNIPYQIYNDNDYDKLVDTINKKHPDIYISNILYELLTDSILGFNTMIIDNRDVDTDDDLFLYTTDDNYDHIVYEYIVGTNYDSDGTIDIIGIKKTNQE